jgi:DNA-binding PadR family transcriptional regulator
LNALALIEGRDAERSGGPAKTLFELTDAGEQELDTWLATDTSGGLRLRAPAVLKLLLGHRAAPDQARAQLGQFRGRVSERLAELEHLTAVLDRNPDAIYAWATAQFGVRVCEAIVSWIDEVTARLPREALAINPRRRNPQQARALMDSLRGT